MSYHPNRRRPRRRQSPMAAITTESLAILGFLGLLLWTSRPPQKTKIESIQTTEVSRPLANIRGATYE